MKRQPQPEAPRAPGAQLDDRRRNRRVRRAGIASVLPGRASSLVDSSENGVAIESSDSIRVGGSYRVRLPGVSAIGIVRWSRLARLDLESSGERVPVYRSGLEIRDR